MITDNALKNYTTKIDPMRTAAEIDYILASNGATAIQKDITNGQITALRFTVQTSLGLIPIQLPVNVEAVQQILKKMREQKVRANIDYSKEQAVYSADKRMKDWEKQSCIDSAMVFVGALAAIAVDENWSKLAPKATRIKVFAEVLKEALESTNEVTSYDGLTDKQKKTAEIIAKTLGLPWRLGDGQKD